MASAYYAICPGTGGTSDKKTGSPTITIASGVATLSVAQTGNIGQGFRITYDTSKVCFISKVNSSTSFDVVTATGGTPSNEASAVTVNSIAADYASLSAAEAGASNSSHLNTSDLATAKTILNLVCYAGASADATSCTVDGYTTSTDYYINIYAANGGTQSLSPNRHAGVWDTSKYYLSSYQCLMIQDTNVSISGLQIEMASTGNYAYGIHSNIALSNGITRNCIVKDNRTGTYRSCYRCIGGQIYENCIAINGAYAGFYSSSGNENVLRVYIYNCTAFGCGRGIDTNPGGTRVRNCAVFNNTDDFKGTFESIQYCASDDNDGTNAVDISPGATEADDWNAAFTDYANGDFSVKDTSSPLYDAGTDLSDYFTTDIAGTTRSTWDIGAFEYVASGGGGVSIIPIIMNHLQKMRAN